MKKKARQKKKVTKKKVKRIKRPKYVTILMAKIRKQILDLAKAPPAPAWTRKRLEEEPLTVDEYKRLDPLWQTTMTGKMTGRVIEFRKKVESEDEFCTMGRVGRGWEMISWMLRVGWAISRIKRLFLIWDEKLDTVDKEFCLRRIRDREPALFYRIAREEKVVKIA